MNQTLMGRDRKWKKNCRRSNVSKNEDMNTPDLCEELWRVQFGLEHKMVRAKVKRKEAGKLSRGQTVENFAWHKEPVPLLYTVSE